MCGGGLEITCGDGRTRRDWRRSGSTRYSRSPVAVGDVARADRLRADSARLDAGRVDRVSPRLYRPRATLLHTPTHKKAPKWAWRARITPIHPHSEPRCVEERLEIAGGGGVTGGSGRGRLDAVRGGARSSRRCGWTRGGWTWDRWTRCGYAQVKERPRGGIHDQARAATRGPPRAAPPALLGCIGDH